ncbi:MFS transporter [Paraferrimonas sedimenticola]|uniref:MFS transporter n=1 Tax=Paraferrimonas sedimenticola TaxID=375674 RepID=A0AA37RYA9_9GAMM|nr:MFS transporter [Paraferrimonas sedimenticola]GLP97403.1 MFS transporter [Paraferrimonas sedimenticola]
MSANGLSGLERKVAITLASVFGLRMMGLFMILPVFALYATHLEGITPFWVGVAIGAYGLTQAMLQIPMGVLSDRWGRKPVILLGLSIFALGSLVAANADTIYEVVIGRALQGMGAIASAVLALAADLTREQQRTKVMAIIGACIGLSFALSLLVGPVAAEQFGLDGLFLMTAAFAVGGMAVVAWFVPTPITKAPAGDTTPSPKRLLKMLKDPQLVRLDIGILILHLVLTAVFVALPLDLVDAGLAKERHWQLYFPAFAAAFVLMVPLIIYSMKRNASKQTFQFAMLLMITSLLIMGFLPHSLWALATALLLFFVGFNFLEASLPSLISKFCPTGEKGSAMGVYSTSQFFGAFLGGMLGGAAYQFVGASGVFFGGALLIIFWFGLSFGMQNPKLLKSFTLSTQVNDKPAAQQLATELSALVGVVEAIVVLEENAAYLKVDDQFDLSQARAVIGSID